MFLYYHDMIVINIRWFVYVHDNSFRSSIVPIMATSDPSVANKVASSEFESSRRTIDIWTRNKS